MYANKCLLIYFAEPPAILFHSKNDKVAKLSENATFYCNASGSPAPQITWYKDANLIDSYVSPALKLQNLTSESHGQYRCRASNIAGFSEAFFSLAVEGKSSLIDLNL